MLTRFVDERSWSIIKEFITSVSFEFDHEEKVEARLYQTETNCFSIASFLCRLNLYQATIGCLHIVCFLPLGQPFQAKGTRSNGLTNVSHKLAIKAEGPARESCA